MKPSTSRRMFRNYRQRHAEQLVTVAEDRRLLILLLSRLVRAGGR
ncbi:MAG: hypothetical protein U0996_01345 [Planctomycetaceae bacterium]